MKNERSATRRPLPRSQRGAAAVEFGLVFPLLFALTYGAIVYSYVYVLRQSLTFAAQEAAQAAVGVRPGPGYDDLVRQTAVNSALAAISWMPVDVRNAIALDTGDITVCDGPSAGPCSTLGAGESAVVVQLQLPLSGGAAVSPLFATFNLPGLGQFPPLPNMMTGQAVARL